MEQDKRQETKEVQKRTVAAAQAGDDVINLKELAFAHLLETEQQSIGWEDQ